MRIKVLIAIFLVMFFTQCKKEDVMVEKEGPREVEVSIELTLEDSKTFFGNILETGSISWWNQYNEECFYLSIEYLYIDDNNAAFRKGLLKEFKFFIDEYTDKVSFKGFMPENYLADGLQYTIYYFGNNGNGRENTNVTNIYDEMTGELIGKTISFDKQNGDIRELGNYHLASVSVTASANVNEEGVTTGYMLQPDGPLRNRMSIALLDLTGETELSGSATYNSVFEVKWNGKTFEERIYSNNTTFDVKDNVGNQSFISLLPNESVVTLECDKGQYVFDNGIGVNNIYIGQDSEGNVRPLVWRKP